MKSQKKPTQKEEVELEENMKSAAKEMQDYASKHGGMDKADFHKAAKHMQAGNHKALHSLVKNLDSDPRDKILTTLNKHGNDIKRYGYSTEGVALDELSVKTLSSYAAKASDARGHRGMSTKKVDNRYAGVAKAGKRMDKQMEDAEQVDELNKDTLRSYAGKALKTAKGKKIGQRMTGRAGALDRLSGWHAAKMKNPTPTQSKVARPYKAK